MKRNSKGQFVSEKKGRRRKDGTLSGLAAAKKTANEVFTQAAKPTGVIAGLVASGFIGKGIDKLVKVEKTEGKFNPMSLIKPGVLLIGGIGTAIATRNQKGGLGQLINGFGYGVAGGGVISVGKAVAPKIMPDLFGGLGDSGKVYDANLFLETPTQKKKLRELLAQNSFKTFEDTPMAMDSPIGVISRPGFSDDRINYQDSLIPV